MVWGHGTLRWHVTPSGSSHTTLLHPLWTVEILTPDFFAIIFGNWEVSLFTNIKNLNLPFLQFISRLVRKYKFLHNLTRECDKNFKTYKYNWDVWNACVPIMGASEVKTRCVSYIWLAAHNKKHPADTALTAGALSGPTFFWGVV